MAMMGNGLASVFYRGKKMTNDKNIQEHEARIIRLEVTIENINAALIDIKKKLDLIDARFETKFDKLEAKIWSLLFWTVSGFAALLAVMAHGFHWI